MDSLSLFLILPAVAILGFSVWPYLRARRLRGLQAPPLAMEAASPRNALIYFWSPNCGLCRGMTPIIQRLQGQWSEIVMVNVMERMDLARRYRVMALPTLVRVRDGQVADIRLGAQSERKILALLD